MKSTACADFTYSRKALANLLLVTVETLASSLRIHGHRFRTTGTGRTSKVTLEIPDQVSPLRRLNAGRCQRGLQLRRHSADRFLIPE